MDMYDDVDPSNPGDTCAFDPEQSIDKVHDLITLESLQVSIKVQRYAGYYLVANVAPILVIG